MGFKDHVASDSKVFMNTDEFADIHDIDGQQIGCIFDDDTYQQQKSQDGVHENVALLFVKASALPDRPVPRQHMWIDGELRIVRKCVENAGMLEITLEANDA